jgi:hypothetical protein
MTALALVLVFAASSCLAQSVPLFVIERSLNANVVHYDARITPDGKLDPHQPVVAYWIMAAEDGRRQELNLAEKYRAYGFTAQPDPSGDSCRMMLAAERKREIHVYRQGGAVRAEIQIAGHHAFLQRVFVTTHKAYGIQVPSYVELFGADVVTGEPCYEKLLPGK